MPILIDHPGRHIFCRALTIARKDLFFCMTFYGDEDIVKSTAT